jgi:hypothetical protein
MDETSSPLGDHEQQIILATEEMTLSPTVIEQGEDTLVHLAILYSNTREIVLVNPGGFPIKTIQFQEVSPTHIAWSKNGCELIVTTNDGKEIQLLRINIFSEKKQIYFTGGRNESGEWLTWPSISPDGNWVSYAVWIGGIYYDNAEFHDIELMSMEDNNILYRLTKNGGAWMKGASWSPAGDLLAYSDFDKNGIAQVFISSPNGDNKKQLTYIAVENNTIGSIKWSPNGQLMTFGMFIDYKGENQVTELWLLSLDDSPPYKIPLSESDVIVDGMIWWGGDSEMILVKTDRWDEQVGMFHWIDTNSGQIIRSLPDNESPIGYPSNPFPLDDIWSIGMLANEGDLYIYDYLSDTFSFWADHSLINPNRNSDIREILPYHNERKLIEKCGIN